ncbi:MAG: DUF4129 domain-containing protein [Thermoplasmata archaeon]
MSTPGPRRRPSLVLFAIIALALAIGAAASVVAGAASAPAFQPGPGSYLPVTQQEVGLVLILLFAVVLGLLLYHRIRAGSMQIQSQFAIGSLAILFAMVLLVAILDVVGGGGWGWTLVPAGNSTGPGPGTQNDTGNSNQTLAGGGGQNTLFSLHLPPWALFAIVAGIVLVVGAVAFPRLRKYAAERSQERGAGRPTPADLQAVRSALATAEQDLEGGGDPRTVIIALYASVLRRIGRWVGGVDPHTPEEIRSRHLVRLGIRADAAGTLTRLFEEARYSSHPLGPEAVSRATVAIREAQEDLDRIPLLS